MNFSKIVSSTIGICELNISDNEIGVDFIDVVTEQIIDSFSIQKYGNISITQRMLQIIDKKELSLNSTNIEISVEKINSENIYHNMFGDT